MADVDDLLIAGVRSLGPRPADDAPQREKNPWVSKLSNVLALAMAEELRRRGMTDARPVGDGDAGVSGAERRLAGGLGAKKVDVTWATEESGLMFAASIKTIMYRDATSLAYQKNLINRRNDLLMEAVTLHRRFPYAVVTAFFFLDIGASRDGTPRRKSTFENVFPRFRLFTGRKDPADREEQFEGLYVILLDSNSFAPTFTCYEVNNPNEPVEISDALDRMIELTVERNFDLYELADGIIRRTR